MPPRAPSCAPDNGTTTGAMIPAGQSFGTTPVIPAAIPDDAITNNSEPPQASRPVCTR